VHLGALSPFTSPHQVGFTPRYRHLKHPKKQLVYLLDDLANPDQMEGGFNP
jgi:hypothetical protein